MNQLCLAALFALTAAFAVQAQTNAPAAEAGFPARVNAIPEPLKQFDKDGDGKLSETERTAMMESRRATMEKMRKEREKEFDKNGDGKLDEAESAAMKKSFQEQREKLIKEREKEFDKDGDGKLSEDERKAMFEEIKKRHPEAGQRMLEMIKKFDKDGDGKLSEEERKAMMEARGPGGNRPRVPPANPVK